jgi:hypothetical protein
MATAALGNEAGSDRRSGDGRESFAVVHGLYWLTANIAAGGPVLIVVDDAHWVDGPSLRFLVYLARRLEELPILQVLATRPHEPAGAPELTAQMVSVGTARVLRPGPLSEAAVGELLERELSARADARFVAACHEATAGNPFYVTELASALRADDVRPIAGAAERIRDVHPETLGRAILMRLSRLSPAAQALARAVAVFGDQAELRHAAGEGWVVDGLWQGARDALSRGAPAIAVQRLRRALAEPPDASRRPELLAELARAELFWPIGRWRRSLCSRRSSTTSGSSILSWWRCSRWRSRRRRGRSSAQRLGGGNLGTSCVGGWLAEKPRTHG